MILKEMLGDFKESKLKLEGKCEKYKQEIKLLKEKCQEQQKQMVCITLNIRILYK